MSDLDLATGTIYCRRAKGSRSSLHPMKPDEVAALEKVLRDRKPPDVWVFSAADSIGAVLELLGCAPDEGAHVRRDGESLAVSG